MILITGATGKTGGELARKLVASGEQVRALVRNADKAAALAAAGVEIVAGDGSDPAAVAKALQGVDRAVLIYPNSEHQLALEKLFVDQAKAAGIKHIVKLSSPEALEHMKNPVHQTHFRSEQFIKASGMPWTMVRPNFFMQNFLGNAHSIKAEGKFSMPMGEGRAAMTDTRDAGAVIAHVLTTPGHAGKSYDITGPAVMTFHDVAAVFSEVLGKPVTYVNQDPDTYKAYLGQFLKSSWHNDAVCDIFREIREGYYMPTTNTFKELMGREPTSFEQFVQDHKAVFS
ncbi:MAG: SDR family oxidoreductase [Steroidobacteraceae bacterium]|nr:SDR family oxidoreductase [Steroidobacteraceae bacterium]